MTDLERRALMGDKEAQEECTDRGIWLPCPRCGSENIASTAWATGDTIVACTDCKETRIDWNSRPNFPIGRCGTCKYHVIKGTRYGGFQYCSHEDGLKYVRNDTDYCSQYEPREES